MAGFNHNNSVLRICVDRVAHHTASGRLFSRRLTVPVAFHDLSTLALQVEQILDQQQFPQAFQRPRIVPHGETRRDIAAATPSDGLSEKLVRQQKGECATLEVQIISRRHCTWQGSVDWLDGSERQGFDSYPELLHLIDRRLHQTLFEK